MSAEASPSDPTEGTSRATARFSSLLRALPEISEESAAHLSTDPLLRQLVQGHALSGIVVDALGRTRGAAVPHELRSASFQLAAISMRAKRLLNAALDALESRGIVPVVLKGYGLASRIYPEPLARPTTDVDLLVREAEVEQAAAGLVALGLAPMDEATEQFSRLHHHHLAFTGAPGMVELHFRALSDFGVHLGSEALQERAIYVDVDGRRLKVASPEDEVLYLALHAAHHLCQRLVWLLDLKLLIQANPGLDWEHTIAASRSAGMQIPAYFALSRTWSILDGDIPGRVLDALRPPGWQLAAIEKVLSSDRLIRGTAVASLREEALKKVLLASWPLDGARYLQDLCIRSLRRRAHRLFPGFTPSWWAG